VNVSVATLLLGLSEGFVKGEKRPVSADNYHFWSNREGLELAYQSWGDKAKPALLCLHGLTRNSNDFNWLCDFLKEDYWLICPDARGRGRSAQSPESADYRVDVYVNDTLELLDSLALQQIAIVGTSMGGLMAMLMSLMCPERLQAVVLNDIGPEVGEAGLARIKGYVGEIVNYPGWSEATAALRDANNDQLPALSESEWQQFARHLCVADEKGVRAAYDARLAEAFSDEAVDLWPLFDGLQRIPTLLVQGALSDLLLQDTVDRMRDRKTDLQVVTIPDQGHAPLLNDALSQQAIADFLRPLV